MPWTEDLSVGHTVLDDHHKRLFAILDRIILVEENAADYDAMMAIIKELNDYIAYHFKEEEAMMEQADFPFLDLHRHSHQTIAMRVEEISDSVTPETFRKVAVELHHFLSGWLVHHIEIEDFEYRPYIAKP